MQLDLDAEAALKPLDRDLDVDLAHAGEQLLARLRVATEDERRVLLGQPAQRRADLLLVAFRLRRHREAHQRLGKPDLGQLDRVLRVEQQVARHRLLQLRDGADVAGPELVGVNVILALELEQRAHALLAVAARVDERRVARDGAVEHAEDVDPPGERIGDRLEHEGGRLRPVDLDRRALLRG